MKLPIQQKFFEDIKKGKKSIDYRSAHINFICNETGEELRKRIVGVELVKKYIIPKNIRHNTELFDEEEDDVVKFILEKE